MKVKANLFRTLVVLVVGLVAVAVALFGVGLRSAETQTITPEMQVQDLGTLGGSYSRATGINDTGKVVGVSSTSDGKQHAFLYDASANPKMQDLGTLGGYESHAASIDDSGKVVGYSYTSNGDRHAFLYDSTNGMQDLNNLIPADSGWTISEATAINSDGKIAASGSGNTPPDPSICPGADFVLYGAALVLTPATISTPGTYEVQDLGTLGSYYSRATGINDSGKVVGYSYTGACYGAKHAFLYDASANPKMQDLGTLGIYDSEARGINDFGQVVGQADDPEYWELFGQCGNNACQRAFLYDASANPKMQNLGTLLGDIIPMAVFGSGAWDINNSGKVVGVSASQVREEAPHGFLYDASAATPKMQDLNDLIPADSGWTIASASAINNDGKIAATGYKAGVGTHALLLTPTSDSPPPADTEAPSPPHITSPQDKSYDTDGSFSVSGSAEAGSTVELFEGTTSKGTTKADSSSGAWSIDLSGVSEGAHTYTAKATNAAGNTSSASNSVTVTVDTKAPKVDSVVPEEDATGVAPGTNVHATFSEEMRAGSITTNTFQLFRAGTTTPIKAVVSYNAETATLNPDANLRRGTKYEAVVSTGTRDLAGNQLDQDATLSGNQPKEWFFTTRK